MLLQHLKINRELLIEKTLQIFNQQGYHSTSMEDIARACDIEKSSLYHHISSRQELLIWVLQYAKECLSNLLIDIASQDLPVQEKFTELASRIKQYFFQNHFYCLTSLMNESIGKVPAINLLLKEYCDEFMRIIESIIGDDKDAAPTKQKATDIFSHIQGALILSKIYNDPLLFDRALNHLSTKI